MANYFRQVNLRALLNRQTNFDTARRLFNCLLRAAVSLYENSAAVF